MIYSINQVFQDKIYRDWGNSVDMMLQPYFPGMIRPIARNFFTLIYVVDPATVEGRSLLTMAESFYSHQVPIRLAWITVVGVYGTCRSGIVWVTNGDKSVTGMTDVSVALLNYYNFVRQDVENPVKALRAMIKV